MKKIKQECILFLNLYYRNDADDGLLCGVLLLPMVTASKLSDLLKSNDGQEYIGKITIT